MKEDWLASFEALKSVFADDAYSNEAINEALAKHRKASGGFVRTMVKGTIRFKQLLDSRIDMLAKKGIRGIKKRPLIILRMGIYAADYMDSVPDYAAVNEAVKLARTVSRGSSGFINGVLRSYLRNKNEIDSESASDRFSDLSFPCSLSDLFRRQYGDEEAFRIMSALNEPAAFCIRANTLKTDRSGLLSELAAKGYEVEADKTTENGIFVLSGSPVEDDLFREGYFSVQSSSSLEAIEAFSPEPGSRVLDMCAAPGGKSAAMAEMMGNDGSITACDVYEHRLRLIDRTAERIGVDIIDTMLLDGTEHRKDFEDSFDYVLADVPCSGLGVIGSKPEIKYKVDVDDLGGLEEKQMAILENGFSYVKPGGFLMYSTCTLNRNENESVTEIFSKAHKSSRTVENRTILPYNKKVGFYMCKMQKLRDED